jgi:excisionase family DNA binding protein
MTETDKKRKLRAALSVLLTLLETELEHEVAPVVQDQDLVPLRKCGVPVRTARKAIKCGELPAMLVGREYLLRRADLAAWLDNRRVKPSPHPERQLSAAERAIDRARRSGSLRVVGGGQ